MQATFHFAIMKQQINNQWLAVAFLYFGFCFMSSTLESAGFTICSFNKAGGSPLSTGPDSLAISKLFCHRSRRPKCFQTCWKPSFKHIMCHFKLCLVSTLDEPKPPATLALHARPGWLLDSGFRLSHQKSSPTDRWRRETCEWAGPNWPASTWSRWQGEFHRNPSEHRGSCPHAPCPLWTGLSPSSLCKRHQHRISTYFPWQLKTSAFPGYNLNQI